MSNREIVNTYHRDPVQNGKGLFRSLIAGEEGRTLTDAFAHLAEQSTIADVSRHPRRALFGARIELAPDEGEGHWNFTQIGSDVYVVAGRFAYKDPRVEFAAGDGLLQFCFNLTGDLTMAIGRTERLRINRPSLLICSQPKGVEFKEWIPAGSDELFVAIEVHPQFLVDHFLEPSCAVPTILRAFVNGTPQTPNYIQLPLNAKMFEIAMRFANNPYTGVVGLVYTEAITLELLCSALDGLKSMSAQPAEQYGERELRCLRAARGFLLNQFTPAPTVKQVARVAGINEATLKRGFKAVFGESLFAFSVRRRMEHALTLLRDTEMQVARVAVAVGYSHQTSFATAFRRHFDLRPKDVRRGKLTRRNFLE